MASKKEIGSLTIGEYMEGLDYAVKKKKGKIISELKENQEPVIQNQQMNIDEVITEKKKVQENRFDFEDDNEIVQKKPSPIEDTQRTQAIKDVFGTDNDEPSVKEKKKFNIFLLISFIIGVVYSIYIIYYCFSMSGSGTNDAENIGIGIGLTLIMPHLICAVLATIFNGLGVFLNKRGFALTGAILYTVACVIMPIYFMFTITQAILSYVGFAKMKRKNYIPMEYR